MTRTSPSPRAGASDGTTDEPLDRGRRGALATVVAVVPAYERADAIAATVAALRAVPRVDRVVVVDDGSSDDTAGRAVAAGATVVRLGVNVGKAGAVAAGVTAAEDADVVLLIDADVARTAQAADVLLAPVLDDRADLVVGTLPAAAGRGGFGTVRRIARAGIRRACGVEVVAPLSGQRAIDAPLLRRLLAGGDGDPAGAVAGGQGGLGARFGLEVAMTIDAVRAGARLVEIPVPMEHRHTGRGVGGFTHRGRQGADVVRALWPRLTSVGARLTLIALVTLLAIGGLLGAGTVNAPDSVPAAGPAEQVVVVGVPHWSLDDLGTGAMPRIDAILDEGALAATSVRTLSGGPSSTESYATIGAGRRVRGTRSAGVALPAGASLEGGTAAEAVARRTGRFPTGTIVVPTASALRQRAGGTDGARPGSLGQALTDAGVRTAVVNNSDTVTPNGERLLHRPAALAVMDDAGSVEAGQVDDGLLTRDAGVPYGVQADVAVTLAATRVALDEADVVVVDPGDTERADRYSSLSSPEEAIVARDRALGRVDALVGALARELDDGTLLLVVGVTPPTGAWALTPTVAWGAGVVPGTLHSASTNRRGLVTITDLAPTILAATGVDIPDAMIGQPLRYRSATPDLADLRRMDDLAGSREGVYYPMAVTFIVVQALIYLLVVVSLHFGATGRRGRIDGLLRLSVMTCAAWPLATFVERAIPGIEHVGDGRQTLVWVLAAALAAAALRLGRRHPLAPLSAIAGATVALLVGDVATGADLQISSVLGYSPHTAARFSGFGNTAFAVLAACAVVVAATHVAYARRRRESVATVAGLLAVVLVADVWPTLGADVGGVLTMVPVFGLVVLALAGRKLSGRLVLTAAAATAAVLVAVTAVDLLRPEESQTHLGRFVTASLRGDGTFLDTVERKWRTNVRLFGSTIWTWMVPITCAFMLYVLVVAGGWTRLLPPRSALRAGVVGTLMAGIIGWLVNDSGVVVSALVFVFIGPYLTLLALSRHAASPEILAPGTESPDPSVEPTDDGAPVPGRQRDDDVNGDPPDPAGDRRPRDRAATTPDPVTARQG
jgi:hypothetical protein